MNKVVYIVWYYRTMGNTDDRLDAVFDNKDDAIEYRDKCEVENDRDNENDDDCYRKNYFITIHNVNI